MANPEWDNYKETAEFVGYEDFLSQILYRLKLSKPGAERICLERIQTALEEFIDYRKRKEEEKEK